MPLSHQDMQRGSKLGIDSHADTSCAGRHARVCEFIEGRECTVKPFNDTYSPKQNIGIVNCAFAYDSSDGRTYILRVNNMLDFRHEMEDSILSTNQSRTYGIVVDDIHPDVDFYKRSKFEVYDPTNNIHLPLKQTNKAINHLHVRRPTEQEMNECLHVHLTSSDDWDPNDFSISSITSAQNDIHPDSDDLASMLMKEIKICAIHYTKQRKELDKESLSRLWHIGITSAEETIKATTQHHIRVQQGKLQRRFKTRAHMRQYKHLGGYGSRFATDTCKAKVKSTRGNLYGQIFCNYVNYTKFIPMKSKSDAHYALDELIHDPGIPTIIHSDGAPELVEGEFKKKCKHHKIRQTTTEPHTPWQNPAELNTGILRRISRRIMSSTNTPIRLWDYAYEYAAELRCLTVTRNRHLKGRTPFELVKGYTPDISEFITFSWYDWVWYYEPTNQNHQLLGRWLGVAHNIGQGMCYHVLTQNGKVLSRSTVIPLTPDDHLNPDHKAWKNRFTAQIDSTIGNYTSSVIKGESINDDDPYSTLFLEDDPDDDEEELVEYLKIDDSESPYIRPQADEYKEVNDIPFAEFNDKYIGQEVHLPVSGETKKGQIIRRKRTHAGELVGTANPNPILDTRLYEVKFEDGTHSEYSTNVLAENLLSQVDEDGHYTTAFDSIVDYRKTSEALHKEDAFTVDPNGVRHRKITTKGWEFCISWTDGSQSWVPLSELKESHPVETAEYAIAQKISNEPAFTWWVPTTIKRRDRIIKKLQSNKLKKRFKDMMYGVKIPRGIKQAIRFDDDNKNTLWQDAIDKELRNVKVAFQLLDEGAPPPVGSAPITYHWVFIVRFDLTRKARLVADGHKHDVPKYTTYSTVASRDSVRIALLAAALNDLDMLVGDIGNAYLNAKPRERVHVTAGPELYGPSCKGRIVVIVRALYGLKSSGAAWRDHFAAYISEHLQMKPTRDDQDVYLAPRTDENGNDYYAYMIVYVDDILVIDKKPQLIIDSIKDDFRLKEETVTFPSSYLGMDIKKRRDPNGNEYIVTGANTYAKEALRIIKQQMTEDGIQFSSKATQPYSAVSYRPELDTSDFCDDDQIAYFQQYIGILRWLNELGRIDFLYEVSCLSRYLAAPRIGHLHQVLNIFNYIDNHKQSWNPIDTRQLHVEWNGNPDENPWTRAELLKSQYPDAEEQIPTKIPKPRGKPVQINAFVDADHAGDTVTRRSQSGILIYANMTLIKWFSKRQATVETSTFGSELVALRIATEMIESIRYKLRTFGIPVQGESHVFCDNNSVVKASTNHEATLKKKHCSIAYHRIREAVAAKTILVFYETTGTNLADLLTKSLPVVTRKFLMERIFD